MGSEFNVIIEQDSDGTYVASVPVLRGCHTQGNSLDQVMERIREVIALCIEEQDGDIEMLDFVGIQKISMSTILGSDPAFCIFPQFVDPLDDSAQGRWVQSDVSMNGSQCVAISCDCFMDAAVPELAIDSYPFENLVQWRLIWITLLSGDLQLGCLLS